MTKKDKQLIEKSKKLTSIDWGLADKMAEQAESEEAKEYLKWKAKQLYHLEEWWMGML